MQLSFHPLSILNDFIYDNFPKVPSQFMLLIVSMAFAFLLIFPLNACLSLALYSLAIWEVQNGWEENTVLWKPFRIKNMVKTHILVLFVLLW